MESEEKTLALIETLDNYNFFITDRRLFVMKKDKSKKKMEVKIMKKKIFYASLVALLMLLAAATALASQPKLTYAYGGRSYPDPVNPGTTFTTNDIYHGRDVGNIGFSTGSPWGDLTLVYTGNFEVNLVSYLGTGINHYVNTNPRARFEGINNYEFTGAGWLIYHGPTFIATTQTE